MAPAEQASGDRRVSACLWCGAPLDASAHRLRGRVLCPVCGTQTTEPLPTSAELSEAYGDWYRPAGGRFGTIGDAVLRRSRATLAQRIDTIAPPGPVLDVGSGDGTLLDALAARGRDATGLERGSERPDVLAADISEVEGRFAAVVFWHSLEHLSAPAEAVRRAAELLQPGGVVLIAVPNSDSLQANAFGDRWFALDIPRHIVHLPAAALIAGLERDGLRPGRVSFVRGGQLVFGWLHGLVGSLPGHPDLYDAIRRPEARSRPMPPATRAGALIAAIVLLPLAAVAAAAEAAVRRGGSVYVEARNG